MLPHIWVWSSQIQQESHKGEGVRWKWGHPPQKYQTLVVLEADADRLIEVAHVSVTQLGPQDVVIEHT